MLFFGVAWGLLGGGLLEELGWTGFTIPRLRQCHSILASGLFVGLLWGLWHFLIAFWASSSLSGGSSLVMFVAGFLAFYLLALPAYRVLMVWVYDRTGSLLVAMLMHASLTASTLFILAPAARGAESSRGPGGAPAATPSPWPGPAGCATRPDDHPRAAERPRCWSRRATTSSA